MEKKEFHRFILPHFQQSGQAYFITWSLKDAIPPKAFHRYSLKLAMIKSQIEWQKIANADKDVIEKLQQEYQVVRRKYIKAYNDQLDAERNPVINLTRPEHTEIIRGALQFWEGKKLNNCAFTIMSNHVHWVVELLEKDEHGKPVYLEDILESVKKFSAHQINKLENRQGSLWQKESFDITIRDNEHMYNAIKYTLNNPVSAGLVGNWQLWPGNWGCCDF